MPVILVLVALLIAAILYALLVRRRAWARSTGRELASALTASNAIAMARIRDAPRRRPGADSPLGSRPEPAVVEEGRTGDDRREGGDHRGGRGSRTGGDQRRSAPSKGYRETPAGSSEA